MTSLRTPESPVIPAQPAISRRMAVIADVVAFGVFIMLALLRHVVGEHRTGTAAQDTVVGTIVTTAILAAGWYAAALALRLYDAPQRFRPASYTWAFGFSLGYVLRTILFYRPLIPIFAITTAAILFGLMLGWRLVWIAVTSARRRAAPG